MDLLERVPRGLGAFPTGNVFALYHICQPSTKHDDFRKGQNARSRRYRRWYPASIADAALSLLHSFAQHGGTAAYRPNCRISIVCRPLFVPGDAILALFATSQAIASQAVFFAASRPSPRGEQGHRGPLRIVMLPSLVIDRLYGDCLRRTARRKVRMKMEADESRGFSELAVPSHPCSQVTANDTWII
ncbi:hypothetical protein CERZMDRAFT_97276 [Cercospora zeae-maydis SCOH1-5]|uniref:Uncharacterized protein n=1 Tax=Cercospora zeae-maydis SCOH1-5 TaxID=717836 RepID=A0A6A6FH95_9PEZI|nr:hypothetical protein CERZMDRAFT_97276 [Cercospora zeae-maydis SCOH1-5]